MNEDLQPIADSLYIIKALLEKDFIAAVELITNHFPGISFEEVIDKIFFQIGSSILSPIIKSERPYEEYLKEELETIYTKVITRLIDTKLKEDNQTIIADELSAVLSKGDLPCNTFKIFTAFLKKGCVYGLVKLMDSFKTEAVQRDENGQTILHHIVMGKFEAKNSDVMNSIDKLLRLYPELTNLQDNNGNTALHIALINRNIRIVEILIPRADFSLANSEGVSAFQMSFHYEEGYEQFIKYLMTGDADKEETSSLLEKEKIITGKTLFVSEEYNMMLIVLSKLQAKVCELSKECDEKIQKIEAGFFKIINSFPESLETNLSEIPEEVTQDKSTLSAYIWDLTNRFIPESHRQVDEYKSCNAYYIKTVLLGLLYKFSFEEVMDCFSVLMPLFSSSQIVMANYLVWKIFVLTRKNDFRYFQEQNKLAKFLSDTVSWAETHLNCFEQNPSVKNFYFLMNKTPPDNFQRILSGALENSEENIQSVVKALTTHAQQLYLLSLEHLFPKKPAVSPMGQFFNLCVEYFTRIIDNNINLMANHEGKEKDKPASVVPKIITILWTMYSNIEMGVWTDLTSMRALFLAVSKQEEKKDMKVQFQSLSKMQGGQWKKLKEVLEDSKQIRTIQQNHVNALPYFLSYIVKIDRNKETCPNIWPIIVGKIFTEILYLQKKLALEIILPETNVLKTLRKPPAEIIHTKDSLRKCSSPRQTKSHFFRKRPSSTNTNNPSQIATPGGRRKRSVSEGGGDRILTKKLI